MKLGWYVLARCLHLAQKLLECTQHNLMPILLLLKDQDGQRKLGLDASGLRACPVAHIVRYLSMRILFLTKFLKLVLNMKNACG
jgi:hypothetical protein